MRVLPFLFLAGLVACRAVEPAPVAVTVPAATRALEPSPSDRLEGYFPDCELVTQDGTRVRFYEDLLRGRVVLIQFLYTRCDGV